VRLIFTFFPIRLASMRPSTCAIVEFSSTMEFSISQCSRTQRFPIDVYGPTNACSIRASRPMIAGPRTSESTICGIDKPTEATFAGSSSTWYCIVVPPRPESSATPGTDL